ncbi:hypothetical protein AZZ98_001935, partial [Serratia marcescens]
AQGGGRGGYRPSQSQESGAADGCPCSGGNGGGSHRGRSAQGRGRGGTGACQSQESGSAGGCPCSGGNGGGSHRGRSAQGGGRGGYRPRQSQKSRQGIAGGGNGRQMMTAAPG